MIEGSTRTDEIDYAEARVQGPGRVRGEWLWLAEAKTSSESRYLVCYRGVMRAVTVCLGLMRRSMWREQNPKH